jgi:hypothetical protein
MNILYCLYLYLLLFVIIKQDLIFALPNQNIADVNSEDTGVKVLPPVSNRAWAQFKKSPGKDQLNAHHLNDTRGNIMRSVFIIVGGIFILVSVGGIISIVVYYIKKK